MYLQITTRCNMTCPHCMFSCTARGKDMTMETVKAALAFHEHLGESQHVFIGGGEPTLHPQFWEIVGLVMGANAEWANSAGMPAVGLVTNGKNTTIALKLAALAETGCLSVSLSRDQYHESIDERVIRAFTPTRGEFGEIRRRENDYRDLRGKITFVRDVGRAHRLGYGHERGCNDCDYMVAPDGTIFRCSCRKERLGRVQDRDCSFHDDLLYDRMGCTTTDGRLVKHDGVWMTKSQEAERSAEQKVA
jgi:MoaA/NifB/PqqE/SkfB family radical SAM enzyme